MSCYEVPQQRPPCSSRSSAPGANRTRRTPNSMRRRLTARLRRRRTTARFAVLPMRPRYGLTSATPTRLPPLTAATADHPPRSPP